MSEIQLTINGRQCGFSDVSPHTRLLDFLRERGDCPINGVWGPAVLISEWFSRTVRRR